MCGVNDAGEIKVISQLLCEKLSFGTCQTSKFVKENIRSAFFLLTSAFFSLLSFNEGSLLAFFFSVWIKFFLLLFVLPFLIVLPFLVFEWELQDR